MEQFIGCDAHKKFSVFVAVNEKGHAGEALRIAQDRQLYREFLARLPCAFGDSSAKAPGTSPAWRYSRPSLPKDTVREHRPSASAVIAIIIMCCPDFSVRRISRAAEYPSISGIWQSMKTAS
jgi:hypothetical protein